MASLSKIQLDKLPRALRKKIDDVVLGVLSDALFNNVRGKLRSSGIVCCVRGKTQYIRAHRPKPQQPETPQQLLQRQHKGTARRHWRLVTELQRQSWLRYANQYSQSLRLKSLSRGSGYHVFLRVQNLSQKSAAVLIDDAPTLPPPSAPLSIEQALSPGDTSFTFIVHHRITKTTGMQIVAEITPATLRLTRAPREGDLRYICGLGPASFLPLKSTGSLYTFHNAQFAVLRGQRYGVRIRIISDEHIDSPALTADFIKS